MTVEQIVRDYLSRQEEARESQATKAGEDGYKVGTDLRMNTRWNPLNGVTLETPNKDFVSHIGVWFQYDSVAFTQSPALRAPSQIGNLKRRLFLPPHPTDLGRHGVGVLGMERDPLARTGQQ